jgi:hypothetical protein
MRLGYTNSGDLWWEELIHGGRHLRNVLAEAENMVVKCDLDDRLAKCLLAAAAVHDLGRLGDNFDYPGVSREERQQAVEAARIDKNNPNYVDHAHLSAGLFQLMPLEDLTPEEKRSVFGAVRDHSIGLAGKGIAQAKSLEEKILGFLAVADHCGDAAAPNGTARAIRALEGKPILSKEFSADHLRQYLHQGSGPTMPVSEAGKYKNESIVVHLVYNHQATWPILSPVRHLLGNLYWGEEIIPRQKMYGTIVETLLKIQEAQDSQERKRFNPVKAQAR